VLARAALWQRRAQAHPLDADTCVSLADLLTPLHAGNAAAPAAVRLVGRQDPTRRAQVLGLTLPYPAAGPGPAVHADAAQPGRGGRGRRGGLPGGGAGRAGRRHGAPQHGAPGPAAVGHAPGAPQCGACRACQLSPRRGERAAGLLRALLADAGTAAGVAWDRELCMSAGSDPVLLYAPLLPRAMS